jgi:NADH dehydrogenase [ubiquinone] 1 alpha subcomplex assembly factor 6
VQEEQVLREGAAAPGLRDAVFVVATRANDHLITAREMLKNLRAGKHVGHEFEHLDEREREYTEMEHPATGIERQLEEVQRGFGTLMPAVATGLWLDQLQRKEFDVFDLSLRRTDWKLPWRAYWAFNRRSF